jgi:AcrR family transcriptional regulator
MIMNTTKDIILERALEQYMDVGYKGLSMRNIAQKAGISATAIYRHYSNKEALFHEIIKTGFKTYTDYLTPALEESSARERFHKTLENALNFVLDHPKYFELIFVKSDTKDELANHDDLRKDSKISFDFYSARIHECIKEGVFKEDHPGEVSVLLLSSFTGFFSLYIGGLLPRSEDEVRALYWRTVNRILNGISISQDNISKSCISKSSVPKSNVPKSNVPKTKKED